MDFDDVLRQIRPFGLYQKRLWIMVTVCMDAMIGQNMIFMMLGSASSDWKCKDPEKTFDDLYSNFSLNSNETEASDFQFTAFSSLPELSNYSRKCALFRTCENLEYVEDHRSVVTEFRLLCDQHYVGEIITAIQMSGVLVGALFWGQMAEWFGRRKALFAIFSLNVIAGFVAAFSVNWQMFAVCLCIIGFCGGGFWSVSFVLVQEIIGVQHRLFAAVVNGWPFGVMCFCLIAFIFKDWRNVLITINACSLPILFFFRLIYESPRWLLQHQRYAEAKFVLTEIAYLNGTDPPSLLPKLIEIQQNDQPLRSKQKKYTFYHIFRTSKLTQYILSLGFSWFTVSCVSFGLAFNVKHLPGNRYFNGFFMALLGGCGVWSLLFLDKYFGRRQIHQASLTLGGIFCIAVLAVSQFDKNREYQAVVTIFALLGNTALSPTWSIVYLYSAELFPTVVRNISNGLCSMAARIGGIVSPFVVLLFRVWPPLPFVIFSALALINATVAYLFLPETRDQPLPDVLPQKERRQKVTFLDAVTRFPPSEEEIVAALETAESPDSSTSFATDQSVLIIIDDNTDAAAESELQTISTSSIPSSPSTLTTTEGGSQKVSSNDDSDTEND